MGVIFKSFFVVVFVVSVVAVALVGFLSNGAK